MPFWVELSLAGKVAVITGGASGIGKAIACSFAAAGAKVNLVDIDSSAAEKAAVEIKQLGGCVRAFQCDVTDEAKVDSLFSQLAADGPVDALVNSAGIAHVGTIADTDVRDFERVFVVNVKGTYLCMKAALRHMVDQGSGAIVNLASIAATAGLLPTRENQAIARVDETLSPADKFNMRYFFDDSFNAQTAGLPAFNSNNDWPTHNGTINETHILTPGLVNLATFMVARNTFIRSPQVTNPANWAALGCASCVPLAPTGIPTDWAIAASNGLSIRVPTNFRSYMMNYQLIDTMSWNKGNHLFQFGGEYSYERRLGHEYHQFSTDWDFNGTLSGDYGDGYADFFQGAAFTVYQNTPLFSEQYKYTPFLYFQDNWRLTKQLTLNLGARWEPYMTTRDRYGHDGAYRPGQQSVIYPLAPVGAVFPGDPGIGPGVSPDRFDRISPRVGFAFDPFGDGKTSIRSAYGIFSDTLRAVALNTNQTNQPFSLGETTYDTLLSNP